MAWSRRFLREVLKAGWWQEAQVGVGVCLWRGSVRKDGAEARGRGGAGGFSGEAEQLVEDGGDVVAGAGGSRPVWIGMVLQTFSNSCFSFS